MKLRTHIMILANSLGILFGLTLYLLGEGLYLVALLVGSAMFIIGNIYGHYISKKVDKALLNYMLSLLERIMDELH